ncbi:hypothetical protein Zm00014a_038294 [Zea mays]|uniref:Uncharacterized protein n=1 Tax=Zea mays TaxID=4577 RepID=A0A3L6ENZ4_MAIZE|nr:hypothetical protein Zm00014a_038294 [Zea mays]
MYILAQHIKGLIRSFRASLGTPFFQVIHIFLRKNE